MQSKAAHHDRPFFSRTKKTTALRVGTAAAAVALVLSAVARADSYSWTGLYPTGDWDAVFPPPINAFPSNWFDNTTASPAIQIPGAADDVTFGGATYIPVGVNMSGPHSVNSITFNTPQAFTISNSGGLNTALTLTSGTLTQSAVDSGIQTIGVPITLGANALWGLNGTGTIVASQLISSNELNLGLTTSGVGNLTLGGQNTYRGVTSIAGSGTVLLTGSIGVSIGGAAATNFIVDSTQGAKFVLASSATDSSALITNDTYVGTQNTGSFTQNGGTHISKGVAVGYAPGANGTYTLANGTLTATTDGTLLGGLGKDVSVTGPTTGTFNQSGGLHQTRQLEVGAERLGNGAYTLSGGTLSVGQATFIGETADSAGLFTQTGGQNLTQALVLGVSVQYTQDPLPVVGWSRLSNMSRFGIKIVTPEGSISPAAAATSTAKYVLSGGTLTTEAVEGLSSGTEFDFNGGTLKPTASLNTFISGLDAAVVQAGGAVIDTAGFNVTVPQPLIHDASLGIKPDGGLTKNGTGLLTLTGTPTYTGPTIVNGGSLTLPAAAGVLPSTSFITSAAGNLTLQGGTLAVNGTIIDSGTVLVTQFQSGGTISIAGGASPATFYDDATTLTLTQGSHTYIGSPTAPGGSLLLQNGALLQLKGELINNGTISGEVVVNTGGSLSGSGTADTIIVQPGGMLHAGNSPGTMHVTDATLAGNSIFQFDINDATGTAGTNWSLLAVDDKLLMGNFSGTARITLVLTSVAGQGDIESALTDFDPTKSYSWEFASFANLTANGTTFQIDASAFDNATNGGTFSVVSDAGSLSLEFTPAAVPEPASIAMLGLASFGCLRRRRRSQI